VANPYYELTQNDIPDPLTATLYDASDAVVDLTAATSITFHLDNNRTGPVTLAGAASVVDAAAGKVQYAWDANDTKVVGYYTGEFQVNFSGGKIITFPTDPKILIQITREIG